MSMLSETEKSASPAVKVAAISAYAGSSIAIMLITKAILTEYKFKCFIFVGFLQYVSTVVILLVQRYRSVQRHALHGGSGGGGGESSAVSDGHAEFPLKWRNAWQIIMIDLFPLPLLFVLNTLSGLGASLRLSMPVFVLLRRFSIVMTLGVEAWLLGRSHNKYVRGAVMLMVAGAMISAMYDVRLDMYGVVMVLINDLCTAGQGVVLRKKLDEKQRLGSHGIMFYNNVAAIPIPLVMLLLSSTEQKRLTSFSNWTSPLFLFLLLLSSVLGYFITYTHMLCTKVTSPLTTMIVGATKNIFTSYVGMLFSDYTFQWYTFIGINVSVVGSLLYSYDEWSRIQGSSANNARTVRDAAAAEEGSTNIGNSFRSVSTIGSADANHNHVCDSRGSSSTGIFSSIPPALPNNGGRTTPNHKHRQAQQQQQQQQQQQYPD